MLFILPCNKYKKAKRSDEPAKQPLFKARGDSRALNIPAFRPQNKQRILYRLLFTLIMESIL